MTDRTIRRGFSVNVFLPAGDPEGLKVVEKSNWTGRGLVIPSTTTLAQLESTRTCSSSIGRLQMGQ